MSAPRRPHAVPSRARLLRAPGGAAFPTPP